MFIVHLLLMKQTMQAFLWYMCIFMLWKFTYRVIRLFKWWNYRQWEKSYTETHLPVIVSFFSISLFFLNLVLCNPVISLNVSASELSKKIICELFMIEIISFPWRNSRLTFSTKHFFINIRGSRRASTCTLYNIFSWVNFKIVWYFQLHSCFETFHVC